MSPTSRPRAGRRPRWARPPPSAARSRGLLRRPNPKPGHSRRSAPVARSASPATRRSCRPAAPDVALPSMERDFGVSAGTVQWVVSGYALTFGLALVPAGRLGDTLGRRRTFLIALAAFVLTSALTGAAQSPGWLIAARLLQGVAGGMLIPQNIGLIQDQ